MKPDDLKIVYRCYVNYNGEDNNKTRKQKAFR